MISENRQHEIQEQRGLWIASAYINKIAKRCIRKNLPLRIRYILEAHKNLFSETNLRGIGGKYRKNDPSLIRKDGSKLKIINWTQIPAQIAILDEDLVANTSDIKFPATKRDYAKIIELSANMSHRLACIHPFENGNGRASRLLMNFILLRFGLYEIALCDDRPRYLNAMFQGDKGDFTPLASLIIEGIMKVENKLAEKQRKLVEEKKGKQKRIIFHADDFKR